MLTARIDDLRLRKANRIYVPYYWDDDDFESVNEAINDLWRRRQWIR